mgnify:FL=1
MIIRELAVLLGLKLDDAAFNKADNAIARVSQGFLAMAGAAGAFVAKSISDLVEVTGQLNDLSQAVGVNTDALQELAYAASLSGADFETVVGAMRKLNVHLTQAAEGNAELAQSFAAVGARIRNSDGSLRSADEVIGDIAERFKTLPDGAEKTALAIQVFGKSGASLIPTLNGGRDALGELRTEARDLGIVLDKQTIEAGDNLGDSVDRVKAAVRGLSYAIAGPLISEMNAIATSVVEWVKANRTLLAQRLGVVFRGFISVVKLLSSVFGLLYKAIGFVIDQWRLFAVIIYSVVGAAIIWNIAQTGLMIGQYVRLGAAAVFAAIRSAAAWAAAAAPIALIAGAIALIILLFDELLTKQQGGVTLMDKLWPKWKQFLEDFINTSSDDDPWWLTMLKGFAALLLHFDVIWDQFKDTAKQVFIDLGDWIISSFDRIVGSVTNRIKSGFGSVRSFFGISPVSGGASGPTASVANTTNQRVVNLGGLKVDQTIVASVGQSASDTGQSSADALSKWWQDELSGATAAIPR